MKKTVHPKKKTLYPTKVNLKDMPDDGESFHFSKSTGELDKALKDLIGQYDYVVDLQLTPAGNAYQISGNIKTKADLLCARCGRDTTIDINDNFHEVIVVMKEKPRSGHSGHVGVNLIDGPYCNYATGYEFNLSEFAHEHIAAAIPYAPYCKLEDCAEHFKKWQLALEEGFTDSTQNNPFSALKNITSKGQRS